LTPAAVNPDAAITFGVIADLGQTIHSRHTVNALSKESSIGALLLAGDLSYADKAQYRWDDWGHMMQPLLSRLPMMTGVGNHEIEEVNTDMKGGDQLPLGEDTAKFLAYNARFRMPSNGNQNLYYSVDLASAHLVFLASYVDFRPPTLFSPASEQYRWLKADLKSVDRNVTPWVFVLLHAPWYSVVYGGWCTV
jgi:hypothetical protein